MSQISTTIIPPKVFRHLHYCKICFIVWEHLITELPVACYVQLEQNASEPTTVSPSRQVVALPFPSTFDSIQSWKYFVTVSKTYYLEERFSIKLSSNVTGYNDPIRVADKQFGLFGLLAWLYYTINLQFNPEGLICAINQLRKAWIDWLIVYFIYKLYKILVIGFWCWGDSEVRAHMC